MFFNVVRKVEENSAEGEIRESFTVFDHVRQPNYDMFRSRQLPLQEGKGFINRQELGYVMSNLGMTMESEEIEVKHISFFFNIDFINMIRG